MLRMGGLYTEFQRSHLFLHSCRELTNQSQNQTKLGLILKHLDINLVPFYCIFSYFNNIDIGTGSIIHVVK